MEEKLLKNKHHTLGDVLTLRSANWAIDTVVLRFFHLGLSFAPVIEILLLLYYHVISYRILLNPV